MIDWSISFGNLLTIGSFLVGGTLFVVTVRGRVDTLTLRMLAVEESIKQLVTVLVQQGRHEERMTAMDQRVQSQGARLDELATRFNTIWNGSARVPKHLDT